MKVKLPDNVRGYLEIMELLTDYPSCAQNEVELFSTAELEIMCGSDVGALKEELLDVIYASFSPELESESNFEGIPISKYPGQDDVFQRGSGLYVLDILLPHQDGLLVQFLEDRLFKHKSQRSPNDITPAQKLLALCLLISRDAGLPADAKNISQRLCGQAYRSTDEQIARTMAGKHSGEAKADDPDRIEKHGKVVTKAKALLSQGKNKRELAAILAPQFELSAKTIRRILKKADII